MATRKLDFGISARELDESAVGAFLPPELVIRRIRAALPDLSARANRIRDRPFATTDILYQGLVRG